MQTEPRPPNALLMGAGLAFNLSPPFRSIRPTTVDDAFAHVGSDLWHAYEDIGGVVPDINACRTPFPPPELLQEMESRNPGCSRHMLAVAAEHARVRHAQAERNLRLERYGLYSTFGITLTCIAAVVALVLNRHATEGLLLFASNLLALNAATIYRVRRIASDKTERHETSRKARKPK